LQSNDSLDNYNSEQEVWNVTNNIQHLNIRRSGNRNTNKSSSEGLYIYIYIKFFFFFFFFELKFINVNFLKISIYNIIIIN